MRILVISNLFPPHVLGGCELLCGQVCELLAAQGHEITVLTSDHETAGDERGAFPVLRRLGLVQRFGEPGRLLRGRRLRVGRASARTTRQVIAAVRPELIFVWNLLRLTVAPARAAQASGLPVVYSFNDENVASYLPVPFAPSARRLAGFLLDRTLLSGGTLRGLDLSWSTCVSAQLKSKLLARGVAAGEARVIYQGIPIEQFPAREPRAAGRPARALYAGQLVESKGIPTLVDAAHAVARADPGALEVTIAGGGPLEEALRARATQGPAPIRFAGRLPHAQLPALYRAHDVLVFPSSGPEAFGLSHLEAMASGTPVISTATGGQGEFLRDGENALVFAPGDVQGLAARLRQLAADPALAVRLSLAGRALVERDFTLQRYAASLEGLLREALRAHVSI